jgi:c-di-GMP-binding flagellar brake protein YcgR
MEQVASNRRDTTRVRALKGAKILFDNRMSTMDCTIRNISGTGAKIVLATPTALPDQFHLRFEDGREYRCLVRWRKLAEFGVEFVD